MKLGDKGKNIIKKYDGCRLNWYQLQDGSEETSVGGHYESHLQEIQSMSEAEIDEFFKRNVTRFEEYVEQIQLEFELNQNQFDALVSFTYNCGPANLKKLVDGRGPKEIAERMLLFCDTKDPRVRGSIERRRWEERKLFMERVEENMLKGQAGGAE